MKFLRQNWFITGIFLSPLLAWLYPDAGASHSALLSLISVGMIFFITGLGLHWEQIVRASGNHKLNGFILGFCFIAFPLAGLVFCRWIFPLFDIDPGFESGTLILSCLPITTASCVTFTLRTKGDAPGALFNAVTSNLIGIFFAPVILTFLFSVEGEQLTIHPLPIIVKLFVVILLPLLLGNFIGKKLPEERRHYRFINEILLIGIVYMAFCRSIIEMDQLPSASWQVMALLITMGALHLTITIGAFCSSRWLSFTNAERRTILFTAPQKTIAVGLPLAIAVSQSLNTTSESFYIFPMLVYNNIQWLVAATLVVILKK